MSRRFLSWAGVVTVLMACSAASASEIGQLVADQVDVDSYRHYLDDVLYTHDGDDRTGGGFGPEHDLARDNIAATFESFGLEVELHEFWYFGQQNFNVIATQVGTVYPDSQYVVGAHYDSSGTPGADDDASGVAGLLELARVLSQHDTEYTIKYMAFDMEEWGLIGSEAYVDDHEFDDILGMVQLDMIAWDRGDYACEVHGGYLIGDLLIDAIVEYGNALTVTREGYIWGSDHSSFSRAGFRSCLLIERRSNFNPCWHQYCDSVDTPGYIGYDYAADMVRSVAGFLADWAQASHPVDCATGGGCELGVDGEEDCNGNGVWDFCDIFCGTSGDLNANGIPDDCEPHQIIYVDASNCPGPGSGSEADPFCTIQEAIDVAGDGLSEVIEIVVADGIYTGVGNQDLDFGGRLITVRSAGGPESCVIDCQGSGRGFNFHNGETAGARVEGLTITNCDPEGVRCEESSPTITRCTITGNTGGGVYCYVGFGGSSDPIINDCTITENTGHGIWYAGSDYGSSSPRIINCTISWNEGYGVALLLENSSSLRIDDCRIVGNYIGIGCNDDAIITNSTITGHTLFGIVCSSIGNHTQISKCLIAGNAGGGVYFEWGARAWITDCTIAGNMTSYNGGGVYCDQYVIFMVVSGCTITGNFADLSGGGVGGSSLAASIIDSVIVGNTANDGGGGARWRGPITNCTIAGNVAINPGSVGGGVYCDYSYTTVYAGCTIAENAAAGSGGGIGSSSYGYPPIGNCILWGDTPDEIYLPYSNPWVTYSDVQGGWTGDGNIDAPPQFLGGASGTWTSDGVYDPQTYQITLSDAGAAWEENELAGKFVNPDVTQVQQFVITANTATTMSVWTDWATVDAGASWIAMGMAYQIKDYHLTAGSPCIDAGDPDFGSGLTDMDDEPRVGDGDGDGTAIVDMGADEYYDCNGNEVADYLDVAEGTSLDCNGNGMPDECEGEVVPCGGLDIRPGSCPNPLNRSSQGILPVVLAGTECFDVTQIDVSTVQLWRADGVGGPVAPNEGPPGPHSSFEDVATPFEGEACDCHGLSGDGIVDLVLKFRTDAVVEALLLDELNHGEQVELIITGMLIGGAEFTTAGDCVLIVPPGTSNANVTSNVPGLFVELSPADLNVDDSGFANFQRIYNPGTVITLTAPPRAEGLLFHAWLVDGVIQDAGETTIDITVVEDLTARAVYLSATPGPTLGPSLAPTSRQPASR